MNHVDGVLAGVFVIVALFVWLAINVTRHDAKRAEARKAAGVTHRYWPNYETAAITIAAQLATSAAGQGEAASPADVAKVAFDYADALALESVRRKPDASAKATRRDSISAEIVRDG